MRPTQGGFLGYGTADPKYTVDVVGDLRVSGKILSGKPLYGKTIALGVDSSGSDAVVDDVDTNDACELRVAGLPSAQMYG